MTSDNAAADFIREVDRLDAIAGYDILDTPPEEDFDDVVRLAMEAGDVPIALVSLVAGDRQWLRARVGFPACQTDLGSSVRAHALAGSNLLVIPDYAADLRTNGNPLVTGAPASASTRAPRCARPTATARERAAAGLPPIEHERR